MTGQQALLIFFGVFWAAVLTGVSRFQPFDTASCFFHTDRITRQKARRRFLVAIAVLNIAPILWLLYLYRCVLNDKTDNCAIAAGAVCALSAFAFIRILHAFIASKSAFPHFYAPSQRASVLRIQDVPGQPQHFWAHLLPGLGYLVVPMLLGKWLTGCSGSWLCGS